MALSDADVQKQVSKINFVYVKQQFSTLLIQGPNLLFGCKKYVILTVSN